MHYLLNNQFAPITSSIGLIKAPLNQTKDTFLQWGKEILPQYGQPERESFLECDLSEAMKRLLPLVKGGINRRLLLALGEDWTAYFDNSWMGSDPAGFVAVMSKRLLTIGLNLTVRRNTLHSTYGNSRGTYGSTMFEVFESSQSSRRSIVCANDGGRWVFEQFGEPYAFEDTSAYQNRKLSDRFRPEQLERYVNEFGINPFSDESYTNEHNQALGYIVERIGELPPNLTNMELAEARKYFGME
jgi:hypothetical protein